MFNLNDQKAVFLSPRELFFTTPDTAGNNLITGQIRFMMEGVEPGKIQNNHLFSLKLAKVGATLGCVNSH